MMTIVLFDVYSAAAVRLLLPPSESKWFLRTSKAEATRDPRLCLITSCAEVRGSMAAKQLQKHDDLKLASDSSVCKVLQKEGAL
jgi:hypothetical protein